MSGGHSSPAAEASLPFSSGLTFGTLDEYLAHLKRRSAYDVPWYRQVSPGRYRLEGGRRGPRRPAPEFTREELERKFGFRK